MIGLHESKMIAAMIKSNTHLVTLNLEVNNLDSRCAELIAVALLSNTNLQMLNLSNNQIGDLGVNWIVQAIIKTKL